MDCLSKASFLIETPFPLELFEVRSLEPLPQFNEINEITSMAMATWEFPRPLERVCYLRLQNRKYTAMTSAGPLQTPCAF